MTQNLTLTRDGGVHLGTTDTLRPGVGTEPELETLPPSKRNRIWTRVYQNDNNPVG